MDHPSPTMTTPSDTATPATVPPRLVTIPVAAQLLGVSRSKLYELLADGALPTVRIGRSRRILVSDLDAFVQQCRELA